MLNFNTRDASAAKPLACLVRQPQASSSESPSDSNIHITPYSLASTLKKGSGMPIEDTPAELFAQMERKGEFETLVEKTPQPHKPEQPVCEKAAESAPQEEPESIYTSAWEPE